MSDRRLHHSERNVILHQYCHIGSWVLIQAGCRISKDVPPYIIMNGNPAEYHGINAAVLQHKHQVTERVLRHIVNAYRLVYQGNFSVQDALQTVSYTHLTLPTICSV